MNAQRVQVFRGAVEGLIESLDATIRLARWNDDEAKPAPLVASAGRLLERLGSASRLAESRFHGTAAEVGKVEAMRVVLKQLDEAYLVYRRALDAPDRKPGDAADVTTALETTLVSATAEAAGWR